MYADEAAGVHGVHLELSDVQVSEVDATVQGLRHRGAPTLLSIVPGHFSTPALAADLAPVADSLEATPGFARVTGADVLDHDLAALRTLCWGLVGGIGIPVSQDTRGRMLRQVRCGSTGLHTCGSDVVALMATGNETLIDLVSADEVYAEVARRAPALAELLFDTFSVAQSDDAATLRRTALARRQSGRLSLRYNRADIEAAQGLPGIAPLTVDQRSLLDLVDEVAGDDRLRRRVELRAGDLLLVNNYALLHGFAEPGARSRTLLRVWLSLPDGRPLPDDFTWPTAGYPTATGRGGVDPPMSVHRWRSTR